MLHFELLNQFISEIFPFWSHLEYEAMDTEYKQKAKNGRN